MLEQTFHKAKYLISFFLIINLGHATNIIDRAYNSGFDYFQGKANKLCKKVQRDEVSYNCYNHDRLISKPKIELLVKKLESKILGDIVDLTYIDAFSKKISHQAKNQQVKILKLQKKVKSNKRDDNEIIKLKKKLQLLTSLEYELKLINSKLETCTAITFGPKHQKINLELWNMQEYQKK